MRRLLLWLALFVVAASPVRAQFAADFDRAAAEAAFPEASSAHTRDLGDLFRTRGMPARPMKPATIAEVAAFLERRDGAAPFPANTSILFYDLRDGQLRSWLIGRQGLIAASRQAMTAEQLDTAIRHLRLSLNVDGIAASRAPRLRDMVEDRIETRDALDRDLGVLSAILLPKTVVAGLKGTEHLLIVANGAIGAVPHAMIKLDRKTALIDRMTVSISPGLYDLDQMILPWNAGTAFANALIVGDPALTPHPQWQVEQLEGAADEARQFASAIGKPALIGSEARKDRIVEGMRTASLIYFAAHGVSNPRDPLRGGFLMLAGDAPGAGFLTAGEVQRMRLRAGLVVLSACQSGLGLLHDGGVIGLSRSFQKAGVPRVLMSLWSVDDAATLALMTDFQKHLVKEPPAVALRLAILETRKSFPEPKYWAPFLLFGTPR